MDFIILMVLSTLMLVFAYFMTKDPIIPKWLKVSLYTIAVMSYGLNFIGLYLL